MSDPCFTGNASSTTVSHVAKCLTCQASTKHSPVFPAENEAPNWFWDPAFFPPSNQNQIISTKPPLYTPIQRRCILKSKGEYRQGTEVPERDIWQEARSGRATNWHKSLAWKYCPKATKGVVKWIQYGLDHTRSTGVLGRVCTSWRMMLERLSRKKPTSTAWNSILQGIQPRECSQMLIFFRWPKDLAGILYNHIIIIVIVIISNIYSLCILCRNNTVGSGTESGWIGIDGHTLTVKDRDDLLAGELPW